MYLIFLISIKNIYNLDKDFLKESLNNNKNFIFVCAVVTE